jgi:hypothetical protein
MYMHTIKLVAKKKKKKTPPNDVCLLAPRRWAVGEPKTRIPNCAEKVNK